MDSHVLGAAKAIGWAVIVIGQYDSPFVRRVAVALQHHGMPYEHRPWSVWGQADQIAELNPLRRVPVVVLDDGEVLIESGAILDAVDDLAVARGGDPPPLIPRAGAARRAVLRGAALSTGLGDKAVSLVYEGHLHAGDHRSAVWTERCTAQICATMDVLERERAAARGAFWFGSLSHADIALACALRFVREAHPGLIDDAARPALAAHAARCEAMPIFAAVVQPFSIK